MEIIIRSVILSFLMAVGCNLFFETLLPKRTFRFKWLRHTAIPAFTAGFLLISFTPIPPFILQPVRFVLVVMLVTLLYFRTGIVQCVIFSLLLCSIYWITSAFLLSAAYLFPSLWEQSRASAAEYITESIFLSRTFASFFPLLSIIVILSISMMNTSKAITESRARFAAVCSFAVINVCYFYFISKTLGKEEEMQRLRLLHEQTRNQMALYRDMHKSYDLQRRQLHDYKNQLGCIQGMLESGQISNALSYISNLTGTLSKSVILISTGHDVVNIILNRKYQEAFGKGITMPLSINGLSELTMGEEDIVILLGNLLDNAIAACEKLEADRIIQFKMTFENGQLILSVRNPVKEPVIIKENKVITGRRGASRHGIGLLNVDSVIKKHGGTSVIKCDNGWFYFSAIIP